MRDARGDRTALAQAWLLETMASDVLEGRRAPRKRHRGE